MGARRARGVPYTVIARPYSAEAISALQRRDCFGQKAAY